MRERMLACAADRTIACPLAAPVETRSLGTGHPENAAAAALPTHYGRGIGRLHRRRRVHRVRAGSPLMLVLYIGSHFAAHVPELDGAIVGAGVP